MGVENIGEAAIGVEDGAVVGKSGGAFVDGFDEQAVRMLGALKSENLVAFGRADDDGIDFAGADGAQCLFKFGDAVLQ